MEGTKLLPQDNAHQHQDTIAFRRPPGIPEPVDSSGEDLISQPSNTHQDSGNFRRAELLQPQSTATHLHDSHDGHDETTAVPTLHRDVSPAMSGRSGSLRSLSFVSGVDDSFDSVATASAIPHAAHQHETLMCPLVPGTADISNIDVADSSSSRPFLTNVGEKRDHGHSNTARVYWAPF